MKIFGQVLAIFVLFFAIVFGIGWLSAGNDFFMYKFFAPKTQKVQRQVFEETPSYVKGEVQELENMEFQYEREKDLDSKTALGSLILHRASGFNMDDPDVPQNLRAFIDQLKENQ